MRRGACAIVLLCEVVTVSTRIYTMNRVQFSLRQHARLVRHADFRAEAMGKQCSLVLPRLRAGG